MLTNIMKCAFVTGIMLMALSGCDLQYRLLYYPSKSIPSDGALAADNLRYWPSKTADYKGFVSTTVNTHIKGTILVFHGNAGTAADRTYYIQALAPMGYRVVLVEYPGYGARTGTLGEESFVRDAKETVKSAYKQYGGPLFLLGESLGCGVAAAAAKDSPVPIDGLFLITPWDNLLSVAKSKFPWIPSRFFMKDTYDSVNNLKDYHGRIAIVGAEKDDIIPIRHAIALYRSLPAEKAMWVVKGAGHNDWTMAVGDSWWLEITKFLSDKTRASK